jgi:hypothetical protein
VIRQADDFLRLRFVADFRPAQDHNEFRSHPLERSHHFCRGRDIPNVNAQTDDTRILRQQNFRDVHGSLVDVEFQQRARDFSVPRFAIK